MDSCWYCNKKPSHPSAGVRVELHRKAGQDVDGLPLVFTETTTYFYKKEVEIPRCLDCQSVHSQSSSFFDFLVGTITVGSGIVAGLGIGALLHITWLAIILGILVGMSVGLFAAGKHYKHKPQLRETKGLYHYQNYPSVKSLKAQGWKIAGFPTPSKKS